ncbi:MAG: biliverdin-producing heme oxygenase [Candidatus Sericytochromatia bacterium]
MTPMEALKSATHAQHVRLEQITDAQRILSPELSVAHFTGMMQGHFLLHKLLEPAVTRILDAELPALRYGAERQKMVFLTRDLQALGVNPDQQQTPEGAPTLHNLAEALGAAYVLEGSTLGGSVIRRALLKHEALAAKCSFHYYACYGDSLRMRWVDFAQSVNSALNTPEAVAQASHSAVQIFELASRLFTHTLHAAKERNAA